VIKQLSFCKLFSCIYKQLKIFGLVILRFNKSTAYTYIYFSYYEDFIAFLGEIFFVNNCNLIFSFFFQ
jgi:hypothetical protein